MEKDNHRAEIVITFPPEEEPSKLADKDLDLESQIENERKLSIKNSIPDYFRDYCKNSSLHGIRYLGEKERTTTERIWWVMAFVLSTCCCAYLISRTWNKWKTSPVILSFEQEQTPLWKIPFPAITICPTMKLDQSKYDYASKYKRRYNLTDEEHKKFWDVSMTCYSEKYGHSFDEFVERTHLYTDDEAIRNIISASRTKEETIFVSDWPTVDMAYDYGYFANHLTADGLCFTFNSLSQADMYNDIINDSNNVYIDHNKSHTGWNLETGYPENSTFEDTYPRRTWNDGHHSGFIATLMTNMSQIDYLCGYPITGFKIMLHNPAEKPNPNEHYILASMDRLHVIEVSPQLTTTSEELQSLHWSVRKCFMQKERSLKYFKVYTQNNCKTECFTNLTKYLCGCVPFYTPRDNDTRICGFQQLTNCVINIEHSFQVEMNWVEILQREREIPLPECNCLPSCFDLQFTTETSHGNWNQVEKLNKLVVRPTDYSIISPIMKNEIRLTEIEIFFKQQQFLALHRSELFSQTDFLASIGGLLGLFMGFSVLSLLEIVYFMTVSLYCKYAKKH